MIANCTKKTINTICTEGPGPSVSCLEHSMSNALLEIPIEGAFVGL
jgi:hypothetical protein